MFHDKKIDVDWTTLLQKKDSNKIRVFSIITKNLFYVLCSFSILKCSSSDIVSHKTGVAMNNEE